MPNEEKKFTILNIALDEEKLSNLKTCFRSEADTVQVEIEKRAKQAKRDVYEYYANMLFITKVDETYKPAKAKLLNMYREMYKAAINRGVPKETALQTFGLTEAELVTPEASASRGAAKRLAILDSMK